MDQNSGVAISTQLSVTSDTKLGGSVTTHRTDGTLYWKARTYVCVYDNFTTVLWDDGANAYLTQQISIWNENQKK